MERLAVLLLSLLLLSDAWMWTDVPSYLTPTGKKTGFLSHLYIKVIFLPRQARDRHRESTQKKPVLSQQTSPTSRTARSSRLAPSQGCSSPSTLSSGEAAAAAAEITTRTPNHPRSTNHLSAASPANPNQQTCTYSTHVARSLACSFAGRRVLLCCRRWRREHYTDTLSAGPPRAAPSAAAPTGTAWGADGNAMIRAGAYWEVIVNCHGLWNLGERETTDSFWLCSCPLVFPSFRFPLLHGCPEPVLLRIA